MKKLGKKNKNGLNTIEFFFCTCACTCTCNCSSICSTNCNEACYGRAELVNFEIDGIYSDELVSDLMYNYDDVDVESRDIMYRI